MPETTAHPRRGPRWVRWCVVLGVLLAVAGAGTAFAYEQTVGVANRSVTQQNLLGAAGAAGAGGGAGAGAWHATITGPKNILLVGIDARKSAAPGVPARSDSIILLHIAADHRSAYLISLPRDSYVEGAEILSLIKLKARRYLLSQGGN